MVCKPNREAAKRVVWYKLVNWQKLFV